MLVCYSNGPDENTVQRNVTVEKKIYTDAKIPEVNKCPVLANAV